MYGNADKSGTRVLICPHFHTFLCKFFSFFLRFPVPLDKGNEVSGNEIGLSRVPRFPRAKAPPAKSDRGLWGGE